MFVFCFPILDHVMGTFLEHSMPQIPVHAKSSFMVDAWVTRTTSNQYRSVSQFAASLRPFPRVSS
ncbi:hypothetical protein HOLleu_15853 [Holothuria leucospilota]|uniref:Uncharacterized protein n=1 Tax=Holothuria leucospilota TaxID=206669 RepID=A0A9Q1H7E4_HOLLE|nr:hypothetical protein HOLleu_15853 [Holothuria leucospilota]